MEKSNSMHPASLETKSSTLPTFTIEPPLQISSPPGMQTPTLRDFMMMLFRRRTLIIISFLAIFLGAGLRTYMLPKQYETHMKILIKRERANAVVTPTSESGMLISKDITEQDLNSEVQLLKSRDLLEKVAITCKLQEPAPKRMSYLDKLLPFMRSNKAHNSSREVLLAQAVQSLEGALTVEPVAKTNMIEVSYNSQDPRIAVRVLKTLAALYLEKHVSVHRPPGVLDFFQQQTAQYHADLEDAEQRLAKFGRDEEVVSIDLEKDITLHKLSQFEVQLRETQTAQAAAEQRIRLLESQLAVTPARVTTQMRTSDNPYLLQQLKSTLLSLELKRTELLTKYDPSYRLVQEADQEIAQTREAIRQAESNGMRDETTDLDRTHAWMQEELARVRAELATLKARSLKIAADVQVYRESARQLSSKEIKHQDLARVAKTAEENYLLYLRKQEEARIADELDRKRIVNVAIAEAATIPTPPSNLRKILFLGLGFVLALVVSLGLAMILDYVDPCFRTPDEVERIVGIPVLASLPRN